MTPNTCKPIFITGMDRSGTSLIASIVNKWGAYGGEKHTLYQGNHDNPEGFYEYIPLQEALGDMMGNTPFWIPEFPQILDEIADDPGCRRDIEELISQMDQHSSVWFWKEPSLGLLTPLFREFFKDIVFIIPIRNPYDSAVSWERFMVPPEMQKKISMVPANLLHWQYVMREILEQTDAFPNRIFISYEMLIKEPEIQCQRLAEFLNTQYSLKESLESQIDRMVQTVKPDLRRNRSETPFHETEQASEVQINLFNFLQNHTKDSREHFDPCEYPMPPGWREHLSNVYQLIFYYNHSSPVMNSKGLPIYLRALRIMNQISNFSAKISHTMKTWI